MFDVVVYLALTFVWFFLSDMSLPAGFGVKSGRAQTQGASGSKILNKVSVGQSVSRKSPPRKKDLEKRKPKVIDLEPSKRPRVADSTPELPFEAPVTAAGDWFGRMADTYFGPGRFHNWQQRNGEQAAEACRRAAGELFFHLTCNPSDTEKLKARLDATNEENANLKKQLSDVTKDKTELERFKSRAEKDIPRLKLDADNLRYELNKTAQELTASGERALSLETTVENLRKQLDVTHKEAFAEGFRSYVAGFLAVDPDYDWGKFVPATRTWIEEFKIEQAKAIKEKRMEIELEAASESAQKFLQQPSPQDGAHPDGEMTEDILQLEQAVNEDIVQGNPVSECKSKCKDNPICYIGMITQE